MKGYSVVSMIRALGRAEVIKPLVTYYLTSDHTKPNSRLGILHV